MAEQSNRSIDELTFISVAMLDRARLTLGAVDEAEASLRSLEFRIDGLETSAEKDKSRIQRIADAFAERVSAALLAGDTLPVPPDRDLRTIERLNARSQESLASIQVLVVARTEAASRLSSARFDHANATLELLQAVRDHHTARIRDLLSDAQRSVAVLFATDIVQLSLIGRKFEFDGSLADRLFSGERVASRLVKTLPPQVRPAELAPEVLDRASSGLVADMLASIRRKSQ